MQSSLKDRRLETVIVVFKRTRFVLLLLSNFLPFFNASIVIGSVVTD